MANPDECHWEAALRCLNYVKATRDKKLTLGGTNKDPPVIYSDSDWAGDPSSRRSTSGLLTMFRSSPVAFASTLQKTVALSSAEAEYIALSPAVKQALWMRKILSDFNIPIKCSITVHEDNQAAIAIANDHGRFHRRTKHIDVRYHFVRQHVKNGNVVLQWIPTAKMLADMYTKPLVRRKFVELADKIMPDVPMV